MNSRVVFIASFGLNLALAVVALLMCPGEVAIHFGGGGEPNGWAPAYVNALIMSAMNALVFFSFYFVPHLVRVTPSRWLNLPNKEYWLQDENQARMESILAGQMYRFGALTLGFMFVIGVLVLKANLSEPVRLREDLFWWPFGLYIAYTIYWTINLMFVFRVPKEEMGRE